MAALRLAATVVLITAGVAGVDSFAAVWSHAQPTWITALIGQLLSYPADAVSYAPSSATTAALARAGRSSSFVSSGADARGF